MRARRTVARHEKQKSDREVEDLLVTMDYGYLKHDGTEDDNDDEDDEDVENKLHILVVKDSTDGNYAATCLGEKGV